MRADLSTIYRFCRTTDDIGDEGAQEPAARLAALDTWEEDLRRAVQGQEAAGELVALGDLIERRRMGIEPFLRLIEANRMDQRRGRWQTHDDLLDYCRHSATPVGEMVLAVLGYHDRWRLEMSDRTCTGLQLVNFWQDIGCDLRERGRVYLPVESMARFDVSERDLDRPIASPAVRALVAEQVGIARDLLVAGEPLHRFVPARVALDLRMFSIAGLALCNAIARQGHDTLARRPAPGVRGRVLIAATAIRLLARGAR